MNFSADKPKAVIWAITECWLTNCYKMTISNTRFKNRIKMNLSCAKAGKPVPNTNAEKDWIRAPRCYAGKRAPGSFVPTERSSCADTCKFCANVMARNIVVPPNQQIGNHLWQTKYSLKPSKKLRA